MSPQKNLKQILEISMRWKGELFSAEPFEKFFCDLEKISQANRLRNFSEPKYTGSRQRGRGVSSWRWL